LLNPTTSIDLTVTVFAGNSSGLLDCDNGAPFIDFDGATICSSELIDSPYEECTPTTNCILYQIGTSSASVIPYSYIDCEGNEGGGALGGAGGFDSDTFCAEEGSVNSGGMTLIDEGPCES
jgi:hypothetical protein